MTEMPERETLQRLMPPTVEPDVSVDWAQMGESWGKEFPSDYRWFIGLYGSGTVQNYLVVQEPEPKGDLPKSEFGGMLHETVNARNAWARGKKSPELVRAEPELIAWAADSSADILCWDASGDDPGAWPVLVYNRDDNLWSRYDCGMVEFISRLLRADFGDCPLGDLSLWGRQSAAFLTESEKRRLLKEGLDPWTGEPDPFAGMFGD
ncbi:SMI1/KNR4 family protein [Streptomyces sp. H51]|uniref:SMI1/KNR4 family protein n=1 Tax=Streptomyces sp. H51 TaxID=3111770 RepID=UPI002D792806|nr:SMI1/KNR4 family protein [Streptomyces sp. H51]